MGGSSCITRRRTKAYSRSLSHLFLNISGRDIRPCVMNMHLLLIILAMTMLIMPIVFVAADSPCIQAHFGDTSYAGGMVYDAQLEVIYVTGQVGPSSCFVGVLKPTALKSRGSEVPSSSFNFVTKQVFEESAICQTLTLRRGQTGTLLLLSTMEEGGILTDNRPNGSQKAVQYGGMIELQFDTDGSTSHFAAERSILLHQDIVQIPRSIVADPNLGNRIFVVTMTSQSSALQGGERAGSTIPNLTSGGTMKYGNNYAMTIESLRLASSLSATETSEHPSMEAGQLWKKPFGVVGDTSGVGVTVNQLIFHGDDELIAVGSTKGSGSAFGEGFDDTMAGFIAKFSPDHGQVLTSKRFYVEMESSNMPTYLEATCQDENDLDSLYIVGSYEESGTGKKVPFVTKLSTSSLESVWEQRFPATTNAYAVGCGVSHSSDSSSNERSGSVVYLAGIVENGGEIMGQTTSHLQDDVFVIQVSTRDGSALWMKQVGTSGNDRLAHGGNGIIVMDDEGVLLMGDTTGNLYSTSSQANEIFVVRVDPQGNTPNSSEVSGLDYSQGQKTVVLSTPIRIGGVSGQGGKVPVTATGSDPGNEGSTGVANDPDDAPGADLQGNGTSSTWSPTDSSADVASTPVAPSESSTAQSASGGQRMYLLISIVVCILIGVFCCGCLQQREREKVTERELVFGYLQAFDVEDIDVRHSATGGWHGTYVGKLAKGQVDVDGDVENFEFSESLHLDVAIGNSQEEEDSSNTTATLLSGYSHSSIVKDSLFVDYDAKPTYGAQSRRSSANFTLSDDDDEDDDDMGNETSSFVRNPRYYSDQVEEGRDHVEGEFTLARLSRKGPGDSQNALDPWGKEIV